MNGSERFDAQERLTKLQKARRLLVAQVNAYPDMREWRTAREAVDHWISELETAIANYEQDHRVYVHGGWVRR
jgi:hypothetical protein